MNKKHEQPFSYTQISNLLACGDREGWKHRTIAITCSCTWVYVGLAKEIPLGLYY